MDEYRDSQILLRTWLKEQSNLKDHDLSKNALVYESFLVKTLSNHINRVLFPRKRNSMTLGHYTTSPLEVQNNILKKQASKPVKPNMTLLESAKTQNIIQQNRINLYNKKVMNTYDSTPLWVRSSTANHIHMFAESQLQQNCAEAGNYQCRVCPSVDNADSIPTDHNSISHYEIQIVRCTSLEPYCTNCTAIKICFDCCAESALARYKRRHYIHFYTFPHTGMIVVTCSCPYSQVMGIPCRHICLLLPIQPYHLHVRWLKHYFTLYGRGATKRKLKLM